jgi:carboxyl-terminal processing protease
LKKNHELEGVILDLRGNPGGLLREAINVVNVFVEKNQLVVTTKGKVEEWNKSYKTLNPAVDADIPLAVLVNRGSASASEIVSGTIQDLDRGVVIGQRTFGKGLVQSTRPLVYNTQLKVTTSKYYIPSGRCIQALDYSHKNADGSAGTIPDSLRSKFKTQNGRIVYDGGGIYPDIPVKPRKYSNVLKSLLNNNHIFDYATLYRIKHNSIADARTFKVDQAEYNLFLEFLKGKSYEYTTQSEKLLEEFQKTAQKEKYFESIENEYKALVDKKQLSKNKDIIKYKDEIAEFLTEEIVSRYYYQRGRIEASLTTDQEVKEAIAVLKDKKRYQAVFEPTFEIKRVEEENDTDEDEMEIEEE